MINACREFYRKNLRLTIIQAEPNSKFIRMGQ